MYINCLNQVARYFVVSGALLILFIHCHFAKGSQLEFVTCGSVVKLLSSKYGDRLHSHDVKYGSGSGQQSVTAVSQSDDVNSYWRIIGQSPKKPCTRGDSIKCNSAIRLTHVQTASNLHSHYFQSPLSHEQEVSTFGEDGHGDSGDIWTVKCGSEFWQRTANVQFRHMDTGMYLATSGQTYGRPIHGQREVVGQSSPSSKADWRTAEGVYVLPSDT